MSGIVNKVKEVLHKDHTSTTHTTGSHPVTGNASTNHGPHDSNVANKADPRFDSDRDGSSTVGNNNTHNTHNTHTHVPGQTGYGNKTAGPHDSNAANKLDPRVDSDRDGSHTAGTTGTYGSTTGHSTTGTGYNNTSSNAGPHDSNIANKVDPRVDSDRDGSRTAGTSGTYGSTTGHSTTGTGYNNTSTNAGPHNSNLLNKADPRVDSDRDGSHNAGGTTTSGYSGTHAGNTTGHHTGTTGGISHSTNAGPHDSNLANKADPRVDSDLDGKGNRHGADKGGVFGASGSHATAGSGTAQNTAGPHNSDLLNKLDPRVDSDRDGSKTYGGNKTHA